MLRGTAQNPDVFFQAREAANVFYDACPGIVEARDGGVREADGPAATGLFEYAGHPAGRARDRDHGLGRGDGARDRGLPGRRAAKRWAC